MRTSLLVSILFAGIATASAATAGVPSAALSTVPRTIVACPASDLPFVVTVRDIAGNPIANSVVTLSFCLDRPNLQIESAPPFAFCCTGSACVSSAGSSTFAVSGADGKARLFLAGGGALLTANSLVQVSADGVLLAQRDITSVDLDDDSTVGSSDAALAGGFLGTTSAIADFDGSGTVDSADLAVLDAHLGHACSCPTPARATSWGRAKILYR